MSQSAKESGKHLHVHQNKTKNLNLNSLLDIRISIRELNDDLDIHMKINKFQLFDFAGYMFERSIRNKFLSSGAGNDFFADESSVNGKEQSVLNKIYRMTALTGRQREILEKLLTGKTNLQMAEEMKIDESTIKGHLQEVYLKLGVTNRCIAIIQYRDIYNKMKNEAVKKQKVPVL